MRRRVLEAAGGARVWRVATLLLLLAAGRSAALTLNSPGDLYDYDFRELLNPRYEESFASSPEKLFTEALALLKAGKYEEAASKAREAVAKAPGSAAGREILGAALVKKGDLDGGLAELKRSVSLEPARHTAWTKIGDVHLARKQLPEAKAAFYKAAAIDPRDRLPHQRLGLILEQEGDLAGAVTHLEKGVAGAPPGYLGVKVNLGNLYNRAGEFEKTAALFSAPGGMVSADPTASLVLGTAYLGLGRTEEAMLQFEKVRELEPQTERGHLALGIALRARDHLAGSLAELEKVIQIRPQLSTGYFQAGETLVKMGRLQEALGRFEKAASLSPKPLPIRVRIGELHLALKNEARAAAVLRLAIKEGGKSLKAFDLLGVALQRGGDLAGAEKVYGQMVEEYPGAALAHQRQGVFFGYIRKYDLAVASLEKARSLAPRDPGVLKALAMAYSQQGRGEKAVATARELLEARPEDPQARFLLATLLQDAGDGPGAREGYREVLFRDPENALALNNLACLLAGEGKLDEARELAAKAAQREPGSGEILDTYGWILWQKGDSKARETLEKAVSLSPRNPVLLFHLGAVLHAGGDKAASHERLQEALAISGTFEGAGEARKMLAD